MHGYTRAYKGCQEQETAHTKKYRKFILYFKQYRRFHFQINMYI